MRADWYYFSFLFPDSNRLQGCTAPAAGSELPESAWFDLVPRDKLAADNIASWTLTGAAAGKPVTHVRLHIFPDGGVSRLRLWGLPVHSSTPPAAAGGTDAELPPSKRPKVD